MVDQSIAYKKLISLLNNNQAEYKLFTPQRSFDMERPRESPKRNWLFWHGDKMHGI